jgi:hypothetical protein
VRLCGQRFCVAIDGLWASIYVWMYGIVAFCGYEALRRLLGHWPLRAVPD